MDGAAWRRAAEESQRDCRPRRGAAGQRRRRAATDEDLALRRASAGGRGGKAGGAEHKFRAFDKPTGKVVAEIPLPGSPSGTPMTYMADGKQYIALATNDGHVVAYSLAD